MGTTFVITLYSTSRQLSQNAMDQAFDRIKKLNSVFSDYIEQSETSQLSANAGKRTTVSDDLWYLIRLSKRLSRQSKGAFDVSIGPLSKLWRRAIRQQRFPDSINLAQAKNLVNYKWIKLFPAKQQVKLKKKGMRLDFGAIAKGYAIDQAYQSLKENGITIALVDGGGDLFIGDPPPASSWDIKDHNGKPLQIKAQTAVASSGDSFQNLQWDGSKYSHIINPKTGLGMKNSNTVTVAASKATVADALSSTLSVLAPSRQQWLLRKYQAKILPN